MSQGTEQNDQFPSYEDVLGLCFGSMDPCDWAATLSTRLTAATSVLNTARAHHEDRAKDISHSNDADAQAAIRGGVAQYLKEIHEMLHAMPMMQSQPAILEALRFILAGVVDIDRGAAPNWLTVKATKKHPKRLDLEAEWVPIIAALELFLLLPDVSGVDLAARRVCERTGRKVGTIKHWHTKLYRDGKQHRPAAWGAIETELQQVRELLKLAHGNDRPAIVEQQVDRLLD